ncbi:MAG TPA: translocation/assembly module TamB domain-containing protein [Polyangiaceae bacterium]|nr:translocation/assembly module TamB domain-containing protein [Polyangiaceae bacterium]
MARAGARRRWWRWPLYLVLVLVTLVAMLFVALRTSFAREQIRTQVNGVLASLFQGKIVLDRLGGLSLLGVSGVDARVFDAQGKQIVRAQGLSATASLPSLAWQFITNSERPQLTIASIHVDYTDVNLREDPDVGVTLASAFLPRDTSEPEKPSPPGSGVRLRVEQLTFGAIWAHGRASGSPDLDAELRRLRASLKQSPVDGFALDLERVELVTRGLPLGADPAGVVSAIVESPAEDSGPLRLEVTLDGHAAGSPLALEASWVGDDVHARVLAPRLPASFINQQASGLALQGDVAVAADVDGPLPQLDFVAEVDAAAAHLTASGYAVVAEGLELGTTITASRVDVARVALDAPETELDFTARALLLEEADSELIGSYRVDLQQGRVSAEATPPLWLAGRMQLEPDVGLRTSGRLGVDDPGASVLGSYKVSLPDQGSSRVELVLDAELDDPARLRALGIHTTGMASVSAELRPTERSVTARASVSLRRVDQAVLQARNVEVRAQLSGTFDDPRLHAAATLDVLSGRAHADLDYSASSQRLELFVADLDLPRLSHVLGVKLPIERGNVNLDACVTKTAASKNYALDATARADLGKLGAVALKATQLELPNEAPTLARLGALRGQLHASGKLELEELSPLLTSAGLPIERTTGHVRFEAAALNRADNEQGLELSAQLDTNGLRVVQARQTPAELETVADAIEVQPLALEGIDVHVSVHSAVRSGEVVGTVLLRDPGGTLAEVQAEAQLGGLGPSALTDTAALARVPLKATLQVPTRRLGSLPPLIRPAALRGRLALDASLEGNVTEPRLQARATLQGVRAAGSKEAVDTTVDVGYSLDGGKLRLEAKTPTAPRTVAEVTATWRGDLRRAGELGAGTSGITASADAKLSDFPLGVVPQLMDRQIIGQLSGELKLNDWGKDARLAASFSSTSLSLGKMPIARFEATAQNEADKLLANVKLNVGSGSSEASLDAGATWGAAPLPKLQHRGAAKLVTRAFKVESLNPLLTAYVSELGGVLDAETELVVTPTSTRLSGRAKLTQGVVQLPAVGQRFSDITARISVENDQFKLEELQARGTTGRLSVKGAARLDGFELRGADAHVTIKEHESVPLTIEGAAIGDAWGTIDAKFVSPPQGEKTLDVSVPDFHVTTPDTGGSSLQSLEADKEIRVGVRRADGKFVALPVQPLEASGPSEKTEAVSQPLRIRVKLGNNVKVERGRTASVTLTGQLSILVASETDVDGRIEVRGGKLDVQGKTFDIERGVITFEGNDPANPTITATARWDAPGYTVYAEYLGDVQNGRIKLHSEPPLTDSEIASLLLFGSPDGSPGSSGSSNNAALAVSVAGDTAAKGLNQVLDDFTNLDVSARIDTTTGSARPELVFQVSPRVSAKVTRAVGVPNYGESPDRTFLTLELRLKRSWALSALFGDRGASALDLIWRRRY